MPNRRFVGLLFVLFLFFSCSVKPKLFQNAGERALTTFLSSAEIRQAQCGVLIREAETKKNLLSFRENTFFTPASNTKIITSFLTVNARWDSTTTAFYRKITPNTVCISSLGDPTFLHRDFSHHPLYHFLSAFDTVLIQKDHHMSRYANGWAWEDYDRYFMPERSNFPVYGNVVTLTKDTTGIRTIPKMFEDSISSLNTNFRRRENKNIFNEKVVPYGVSLIPFVTGDSLLVKILSDTLARHPVVRFEDQCPEPFNGMIKGQVMDSVLFYFMNNSDNFFGEQLIYGLSKAEGKHKEASFYVQKTLERLFPLQAQQFRFTDGSGLSRYNQVTPDFLVTLLGSQWQKFGEKKVRSIFPCGKTGELPEEFHSFGPDLLAKTGSLRNVYAFSGYLKSKKGKWLIFSILINGHMVSQKEIRSRIAHFLHEIASES